MVLASNSASFYTYQDPTRGNCLVTRYGNGIVSIIADKAKNYSASINIETVRGVLSQDIFSDFNYRFNEIPNRTYLSSSRATPLKNSSNEWKYQYSPLSSLNYRYMISDKRGYSRSVRNSSQDYTDEIFASASIPQFAESTYYTVQEFDDGGGAYHSIRRRHQSNKFFSEGIGEYYRDVFLPWGSGAVESYDQNDYGSGQYIRNKTYILNDKNCFLEKSGSAIAYDAIYGSAQDSLNSSLIFRQSLDKVHSHVFTENWASGSNTLGYIWESDVASGSFLSRSYAIGDTILRERNGEYLASWYVSGQSGSVELRLNNKDLNIQNETVIPNVAIMRSYQSTAGLWTASYGSITASYCYSVGSPNAPNLTYQMSSSLIMNSLDCTKTCECVSSYYEHIFSIKYPVVEPSFDSSHESFSDIKGLTFGVFLNYVVPKDDTYYRYQLPVLNFSIDGNIRLISVDKNFRLVFTNSGKMWSNDTMYKTSLFIDLSNKKFLEFALDGKYVKRVDLSGVIGALIYSLDPGKASTAQAIDDSVLTVVWSWFGSVSTLSYDEFYIFSVKCAKSYLRGGFLSDTIDDDDRYKSVNRMLFDPNYKGNLRKKFSGTTSTGAKMISIDHNKDDYALLVSCSDEGSLQKRPVVYPVDAYEKLFNNNLKKEWYFYPGYFPTTPGY